MLKKSKGFMLAEVVVSSTVVLVALVTLYASFTRVYNRYKSVNRYFNIDGVYAIRSMVNEMLSNGDFNKILSYESDEDDGVGFLKNNYMYFMKYNDGTKSSECNYKGNASYSEYCEKIKNFYNIHNMVMIERTNTVLEPSNSGSLYNKVSNQTFKDYLEYVSGYYDFSSADVDFNYIILVEYEDVEGSGNYYYSSLVMR